MAGLVYSPRDSVFRKPRQKRIAILFFTEAAVQCVNLTCYLIPNAYLLRNYCNEQAPLIFYCGWVRWTCWNTVRCFSSLYSKYSIMCTGPSDISLLQAWLSLAHKLTAWSECGHDLASMNCTPCLYQSEQHLAAV